jgi:hypothetical protein
LRQTGAAKPFDGWPCYHTELDTFSLDAHRVDIVGRVVGASFAVLVAEELFASVRVLVSLTSAGQIAPAGTPPTSSSLTVPSAMRAQAIITHHLLSLQTQTRNS